MNIIVAAGMEFLAVFGLIAYMFVRTLLLVQACGFVERTAGECVLCG